MGRFVTAVKPSWRSTPATRAVAAGPRASPPAWVRKRGGCVRADAPPRSIATCRRRGGHESCMCPNEFAGSSLDGATLRHREALWRERETPWRTPPGAPAPSFSAYAPARSHERSCRQRAVPGGTNPTERHMGMGARRGCWGKTARGPSSCAQWRSRASMRLGSRSSCSSLRSGDAAPGSRCARGCGGVRKDALGRPHDGHHQQDAGEEGPPPTHDEVRHVVHAPAEPVAPAHVDE